MNSTLTKLDVGSCVIGDVGIDIRRKIDAKLERAHDAFHTRGNGGLKSQVPSLAHLSLTNCAANADVTALWADLSKRDQKAQATASGTSWATTLKRHGVKCQRISLVVTLGADTVATWDEKDGARVVR